MQKKNPIYGDSLGGAELFALFYFMPLYSIFI